jgi:hypothetical protein
MGVLVYCSRSIGRPGPARATLDREQLRRRRCILLNRDERAESRDDSSGASRTAWVPSFRAVLKRTPPRRRRSLASSQTPRAASFFFSKRETARTGVHVRHRFDQVVSEQPSPTNFVSRVVVLRDQRRGRPLHAKSNGPPA